MGGGNAIGLTMEDNAETGSVENITFTKLSLSGKASINGRDYDEKQKSAGQLCKICDER